MECFIKKEHDPYHQRGWREHEHLNCLCFWVLMPLHSRHLNNLNTILEYVGIMVWTDFYYMQNWKYWSPNLEPRSTFYDTLIALAMSLCWAINHVISWGYSASIPHLYCFSLHLWSMVHFGWVVAVRSSSFLCHFGGYYCPGISLLIIGLDSCIELRLRSQFFICMAAVFFTKRPRLLPK